MKRNPSMAPTTFSTSGNCGSGRGHRGSRSSASVASSGPKGFYEGGHQLEKLEFALAVAMTRGDSSRSELLRQQIAELGGNAEEPGT